MFNSSFLRKTRGYALIISIIDQNFPRTCYLLSLFFPLLNVRRFSGFEKEREMPLDSIPNLQVINGDRRDRAVEVSQSDAMSKVRAGCTKGEVK